MTVIFFFTGLLTSSLLYCAELKPPDNRVRFENSDVVVRLSPRTPEQMAAFYEARKFPLAMISRLKKECFITVGIHNKTNDILWLELENWSFSSAGMPIKRYHRNEWRPVWESLAVPMASQSTFRWTLLPEKLDFRIDESEGGNIILQRTDKTIKVNVHFRTGKDKTGKPIALSLNNVRCAGDFK